MSEQATQDTLTRLRAALRNAEDELYRVQQSDDRCYSNGAYDRAGRVVASCRADLAAAEQATQGATP